MNKKELISIIAEKTGKTQVETGETLEITLEVIGDTLAKGDNVVFTGFGSFTSNAKPACKARVPGSDRIVDVAAKNVVKFKVGKNLKEKVA